MFATHQSFRVAVRVLRHSLIANSKSTNVLQDATANGYYGGNYDIDSLTLGKYNTWSPEGRIRSDSTLAPCEISSSISFYPACARRQTSESEMIPRKRLDIGWRDLLFGMSQCLSGDRRAKSHAACRETTGDPDEALFFLSLRSGFDACLQAARFPRGSHILVSAITIPDILEIIRSHGLVPVPVDLDPRTLEPDPDSLRSGLTSGTVALLATHLFGARIPMDSLVRFARMHGLVLFEDCAQAYWGDGFTGHPGSDVRMFSFGPIKYNTALGGGLLFVGDPVLRDESQTAALQLSGAGQGVVLPAPGKIRRRSPAQQAGAVYPSLRRVPPVGQIARCRGIPRYTRVQGNGTAQEDPPSTLRRPLASVVQALAFKCPQAQGLPAGSHGIPSQRIGPLLPGPARGTLLLALRRQGRQRRRPVPAALGCRP